MINWMHPLGIGLLLACGAGCVSTGTYDKAVEDADSAKAQLREITLDRDQKRTELLERGSALRELDEACRKRDAALQGRTSNLTMSLAQTQAQLEVLRRAQAASEARAAILRDITLKFKRMVDEGDLAIVIRDGRMVLQLPNDILFDTGKTALKPKGIDALRAIARVMPSLHERHFQVSGHTDSVPIRTAQFASNWELSSARALQVVHLLIDEKVDPAMLSSAGYSDVDPVGDNSSDEGKKRNRRTEITLQPMLDELVSIPPTP